MNEGIGDINSNAKGTAARFNSGKVDYTLIPLNLLEGEARVWMKGAEKYGRDNWKKGMPWSAVFASTLRHLIALIGGEDIDPESGEFHESHIQCNMRMIQYYRRNYPEGDDR